MPVDKAARAQSNATHDMLVRMDSSVIKPNQKFSFVGLSTVPEDGLPDVVPLGAGVWAATQLPVGLDGEWRKWIGSIRTERIEEDCNLFLCAAMGSDEPGVLDGENRTLNSIVTRLFDALPLTGNIQVNGAPILISGAMHGSDLGIRHLGDLIAPGIPGGVDYKEVSATMLKESFAFMEARQMLEKSAKWDRLIRIFYIWSKALREQNTHERLHQFCRCIEGLILPSAGSTTSQFVSRTELFVGPREHKTMRRLYEMRSKTEHMHPYEYPDDMPERERRLELMRMTALVQALATYCIRQLLLTPAVWPHYADFDSQEAFWKLDAAQKRMIWGAPADLTALNAAFDPAMFSNEELGLPGPIGSRQDIGVK